MAKTENAGRFSGAFRGFKSRRQLIGARWNGTELLEGIWGLREGFRRMFGGA